MQPRERAPNPNTVIRPKQAQPKKSNSQPFCNFTEDSGEGPQKAPGKLREFYPNIHQTRPDGYLAGKIIGYAPWLENASTRRKFPLNIPVTDEPEIFFDYQTQLPSSSAGYQAGTCTINLIRHGKFKEGYSATIEVKGNDNMTIDMGISPNTSFVLSNGEVRKSKKALPMELSITAFNEVGALIFDYGGQHWNKGSSQFIGVPGEGAATAYCYAKPWTPADHKTEPDVCKLERGERVSCLQLSKVTGAC